MCVSKRTNHARPGPDGLQTRKGKGSEEGNRVDRSPRRVEPGKLGTVGAGSRKRRKDRNPKGRDNIGARKIEETGRGEVLSRINGKIRSKDGPGKSRRDMAENKDSRWRNQRRNNGKENTAEETTGASGHVCAVPR